MTSLPIALVTGASRGIGQAIALKLGQQGAIVLGTATSEQGADAITLKLKEANIKGKGYVLNLADPKSIEGTFSAICDEFEAPSILVNNAAITADNLALRMKQSQWDDVISTNLTGVYQMIQACLRPMIKKRWGRIINISSVVAFSGNPGQINYSAAKAGVVALSKSLASEIASRHITVNCVAPGFIQTDMTAALNEEQQAAILNNVPMNRMGKPEEIADVVSFLASNSAEYITGETIHVNGGLYMN